MDEYTGDKFIEGRDGGSYHSAFYVDWLEEKIEALQAELATAQVTIANLRKQLAARSAPPRRSSHYDSDYVPYPDEDDR